MRVVLHVGPHKTGTTSIQKYLLLTHGTDAPTRPIWYPVPAFRGPGHSVMAVEAIEEDGAVLARTLDAARHHGVETLILSSEDFDRAYPERIDRLARHLSGSDVRLVVTLNSPIRRAPSSWQELVKHGHPRSFDDSRRRILDSAGYRPDFVRRFAEVIDPESIHVVISGASDPPDSLIRNACLAMGLPEPELDREIRANRRLGLIEAELLRHFNEVIAREAGHLDRDAVSTMRKILARSFRNEEWRRLCPKVAIRLPDDMYPELLVAAEKSIQELCALQSRWPVVYHGNLSDLREH